MSNSRRKTRSADTEKPQEQRVFEAVWAVSEDWKDDQPANKPRSLIWFEKLENKINPHNWKKEEEKLPFKEHLSNLPMAMVRALPLSATLLILFFLVLFSSQYLFSNVPENFWNIISLKLVFAWLGTVSLLIGWKSAAYAPGRLNPSLQLIFKGVLSNWIYVAFIGLIFILGDWTENQKTESFIIDVVTTAFALVLLFGIVDMKLYRKDQQSNDHSS